MNRTLRAAKRGEVRIETFEGREHLVFSVVALVEGVMFASTADSPELVLASEFSKNFHGWNGRHLVMNHPEINGQKVFANSPRVLEQYDLGSVFNAQIKDDKLVLEAWLDTERVAALGVADVAERIRAGETVEVSVGVIAKIDPESGEYEGKRYSGVWRDIVPDHLALLPEGVLGACSVEMGCGAPRAASRKEESTLTLKEKFLALVESFKSRQAAATEDGTGDTELRGKLDSLLFAEEPGYLGIEVVYPDAKSVVYAVAPNGELEYGRRSFEQDADGNISLGQAEKVVITTKFETASSTSSCGCGKSTTVPSIPQKEEVSMDKKSRVAAIVASGKTCFTTADSAVLEQLSDERIKALEEHIAEEDEPEEETPEEELARVLAKNPDVAAMVADYKAASAAKRTGFIASIKAASKAFTDEDLNAMNNDQLAKIATLSAKPVETDFSVGNVPAEKRADDAPASSDDLRAASRARLLAIKK